MKLWFLPFVREGLTPDAEGGARPQVSLGLRLESADHAARDISHVVSLLGPGDVISIDPRQVLRVTPTAGTRDAEPEFFPLIEFDAPDLPWAYSPVVPDGRRVLPWLVVIVVEETPGVLVTAGDQGQSPFVLRLPKAVAQTELPDLDDAWAWVHAQVACDAPDGIADTLANHADRTLSRLMAPRRLSPFRPYRACVVPAFLSGRIAGLGGNPSDDPRLVTGLEPAWTRTDPPTELPVYYTWTFRTGEAGDFESLARRLHAAPLDASIPPTPLQLLLPNGDGEMVVDWEPPLRIPGTTLTRPRRPTAAVSAIESALRPGTATRPVLGPAYFGSPWVASHAVTPLTQWNAELNVTPMLRAAAGLGAEAVRAEQDELVVAASAQLEAFKARQKEGRRRQLGAAFVNRVKTRLASAPATETSRVFAPMTAAVQRAASNVGMYTVAGRRIVRKTVRIPVRDFPVERPTVDARVDGREIEVPSRVEPPIEAPSGELGAEIPPVEYVPVIERVPVAEPPPPVAPTNATTIPTGAFTPRFARPMSEPLSDRHPELMLPGAGSIAADGVLLVESNPAFVEAFLVGANQEINYELLWRGLPADASATPFRRFWAHADGGDDVDAIGTWAPATAVGSHVTTGASMILLARSELVRRYPTMLIAAVPAVWNTNGTRSPSKDPAGMVLPAFRGRIGVDVVYAGFAQPSIDAAIGDRTPDGRSGWFFLFAENPGDPRFGLDPQSDASVPTRATLAWNHLTLPPGARYATVTSLPAIADVPITPDNATSASLASLMRQRPFRAFLHASLLVRRQ